MSNIELKPCPFCGRTHIIVDSYRHSDRDKCNWRCVVFCAWCGAETSNHGFDWTEDVAREKAIKAWNRRADNEQT